MQLSDKEVLNSYLSQYRGIPAVFMCAASKPNSIGSANNTSPTWPNMATANSGGKKKKDTDSHNTTNQVTEAGLNNPVGILYHNGYIFYSIWSHVEYHRGHQPTLNPHATHNKNRKSVIFSGISFHHKSISWPIGTQCTPLYATWQRDKQAKE